MKELLIRNGVDITKVQHVYSKSQGCGFLYHQDISVLLFRPEELDLTTFIKLEPLDPLFSMTDVVMEHTKKKVEVPTVQLIDSVWKYFRVSM